MSIGAISLLNRDSMKPRAIASQCGSTSHQFHKWLIREVSLKSTRSSCVRKIFVLRSVVIGIFLLLTKLGIFASKVTPSCCSRNRISVGNSKNQLWFAGSSLSSMVLRRSSVADCSWAPAHLCESLYSLSLHPHTPHFWLFCVRGGVSVGVSSAFFFFNGVEGKWFFFFISRV